jgi:cytochrome oxidase Cu insertion factor (SCO1/SenC/PrrC family)
MALLLLGCAAKKAAPLMETPAAPKIVASVPVGVEVGNRAPSFSLPDTDGKAVALESYRGKSVVLVFYRGQW